jgi:hypothetical protein
MFTCDHSSFSHGDIAAGPRGLIASAIFVFLESLDESTGTYFVGVLDGTNVAARRWVDLARSLSITALPLLCTGSPDAGAFDSRDDL